MGTRSKFDKIRYLGFLLVVGLAGCAAMLWALPSGIGWPALGAYALFLGVVVGARVLAFPLAGVDGASDVSLDSAIWIATAACLGAPVAAPAVAIILGTDTLLRPRFDRHRPRSASQPGSRLGLEIELALRALFAGGLAGGLLALMARLFGVGQG